MAGTKPEASSCRSIILKLYSNDTLPLFAPMVKCAKIDFDKINSCAISHFSFNRKIGFLKALKP